MQSCLAVLFTLGGVGAQWPVHPSEWQLRSVLRLGQDDTTSSLAFSPDGRKLAASLTNANSGGVKLWDVARRQERATLRGQNCGSCWSCEHLESSVSNSFCRPSARPGTAFLKKRKS